MIEDLQPNYLKNKYNLKIVPDRDYCIKENHWLPKRFGIKYFAFGKTLYCDGKIQTIPDHEFIHIAQFHKYGKARVIMHYLVHLTKNYITSLDLSESYVNIPFEKEARYYEQLKRKG